MPQSLQLADRRPPARDLRRAFGGEFGARWRIRGPGSAPGWPKSGCLMNFPAKEAPLSVISSLGPLLLISLVGWEGKKPAGGLYPFLCGNGRIALGSRKCKEMPGRAADRKDPLVLFSPWFRNKAKHDVVAMSSPQYRHVVEGFFLVSLKCTGLRVPLVWDGISNVFQVGPFR